MSETESQTRATVKLGPFSVPPRLKGKIAKRVETRESSLNDVVVAILADHFGLDFEPTGRRSPGKLSPYHRILLDVPPAIKRAVEHRATADGDSQRNVVVRILSDEFKVPFEATSRWPRGRRTTIAS